MFNETTGFTQTAPPSCTGGQVPDYDPGTGMYSGLCVANTLAYQAGAGSIPVGSLGVMNVSPQASDSWTNWLIYGGIVVVVLAIFAGGRRR